MKNNNENTLNNFQTSKTITRKIKNTLYEVTIHFSETSKETINDKIIRLLKREVAS